MENNINFAELAYPFPADDVEWRIAQKGVAGSGKPWAKVLAYVTNRAIMQRLDDVVGPENWKNEFEHIEGAFLCGLSIKIGGEWVTKWDGAQESQIEATKGGLSGAMKRAAVQWGIGRYLYGLEEGFANIADNGRFYSGQDKRNNIPAFRWNPPQLPAWALPKQAKPVDNPKQQTEAYNRICDVIDGATNLDELKTAWQSVQAGLQRLPKEQAELVVQVKEAKKQALGG